MTNLTHNDLIIAMMWAQEDVRKTRNYLAQAEHLAAKHPSELAFWQDEMPKAEARLRRFTDAVNKWTDNG